jgi:perosamine synthetase
MNPVLEFEKRFASKLGTEYAIAVNSGTSALHAALESVDVRHGEVVMPALCPAMDAMAIIHAGAWPVFADVDPQTQLVTHETIVKAVGPRTRAIIAVSLHGLPVDIDPIRRLSKSKGIAVIEDCAQCLFGRYKDIFAGAKADVACFSFEKKKHLTTGSEGGMIVTNDAHLASRARKFAGLGYAHMEAGGGSTRVPAVHPGYLRFDTIGLNYRMSEVQAEIGLRKLATVMDAVWTRQEIGYLWQHALDCQLQPHDYDAENTFYSAACTIDGWSWQTFHKNFCDAGGDGFYAMPQVPYNEPALTEYKGLEDNSVALDLQKRLVLLKTHYSLEEAKRQADILAGVLHGAKAVKV